MVRQRALRQNHEEHRSLSHERFPLAPARIIPVDSGGLEGLSLETVVHDANDPSVLQCEDVEDLTTQRLVTDLVDRGTPDSHDDTITGTDELQRGHIAAKPEPFLQRLDDLIRS